MENKDCRSNNEEKTFFQNDYSSELQKLMARNINNEPEMSLVQEGFEPPLSGDEK